MSTKAVPAREPAGSGEPVTAPRLVALDAFRGFTMFWLMGGKALVLALSALAGGRVAALAAYQLEHTVWTGLRYYDLIWPSFMLMVGVSVPFSLSSHPGMSRVWKRAAVLFLLGSLRESITAGSPYLIELSSALQPIAVAYLVAAYMVRYSMRAQASVALSILAAYGLALALVPAPGMSAGSYEVNRNLVTYIDQQVLGRAHPESWGTVLSTIPTVSTTLLGVLLGQLLRSERSRAAQLKAMIIAGAGCLATGLALSLMVPVIMKLWTVTYGLMSAGWACLIFGLFYCVVDIRGYRRWSFPLTVIGMNALAAYLGPTLVPIEHITGIFTKPLARSAGGFGVLIVTGAVLLVNWSVLYWMHRRRIYLRA